MAEPGNKKRKRQSNGIQTPSKKLAFDGHAQPTKNITVNHLRDASRPVLVSTAGLRVPATPFQAYSKPRSAKHVDDEFQPTTHDLLLQSSEHSRLDYIATPTLLEQDLSHYVAVFDPATNKLQLAHAPHLSLRCTVRAEEEEMAERKTMLEQREELGREFGTKKARKAIASRTVNAISTDTKGKGKASDVQSAVLESVGDTASGFTVVDQHADAELIFASKPIPRPNLEADAVEDVYPFDTLLPAHESRLVKVKELQDLAERGEELNPKHRYPASRQHVLKSNDIPRIKAFSYLMLLLEFDSALSRSGHTGKKVPRKETFSKRMEQWPPTLVDLVRRRFTDQTGSELSKWHVDNLYTHICALTLFIDGWASEISLLKTDLNLDMKQLRQYYCELGCTVARPTEAERGERKWSKTQALNTYIARLKFPLAFPKPRKGRRRA